jgi:hypothetical protein
VPDDCDACPVDAGNDTDGDGACDTDDPCPLDALDDSDGDGTCDSDDPCPDDNPNDPNGDGVCGDALQVFVSSIDFSVAQLGPNRQADDRCMDLASDAGLGGTWVAWISTQTTSAFQRIAATGADGPWLDLLGNPIASNLSALTSGSLNAPINITETGTVRSTPVWTGSNRLGSATSDTCDGFSAASFFNVGTVGSSNSFGTPWTDNGIAVCSANHAIYCFQIP